MQTNRAEQLNRLSETAVNGRIIHKLDLIGIVKICGLHYFNVYRRYNNVYEIVIEDSNGDFYLQRDNRLRDSVGKVLCLSEEQMNSMYTTELYSFRHGGTPPTSSQVPENMSWSEIHREWCGVEINLRGVFEEYHAFMDQFYRSRDPPSDSDSDMDRSEEDDTDEDAASQSDQEDEEEDEYADMPELVSDSEEEPETPPRNTIVRPPSAPVRPSSAPVHPPIQLHIHHSTPICCRNLAEAIFHVRKRTFEQCSSESDKDSTEQEESDQYESEEDVSVKEESDSSESEEEEIPRRGSGPDDYIILRNGTKYRKIN